MDAKDLVTKDARANQKHYINTKLVDIIEYRQSRKWYVSIAVVGLFSFILGLMIIFMSQGKDVTEGWKEILLLMLGGFVGSFAKVIDFWFNNQENDNKLLEHADD
jgi:ABC-type uncharacterized transport system permease subunit|tara:strand:- start:16 stop:330 length:315 start_codon:yes stop_codon:yes gene_type:complete